MIAEFSVVELLIDLLSMALVGAIDVWVGIVGGLALGLPPVLSGAASIAGELVGAVLTVVAGERVQRWIYARPCSPNAASAWSASGTATGSWAWPSKPPSSRGLPWPRS